MDLSRVNQAMRSPDVERSRRELAMTLSRLRARLTGVGTLAAVAWMVLAGVAALVVAMAVDAIVDLPGTIRLSLVLIAATIAIGLGIRRLRTLWTVTRLAPLARRIDQHQGSAGQVLAGVDLMLASQPDRGTAIALPASLTSALADLAIEQAASVANTAVPQRLAPSATAIRPARILVATTIGIIVLAAAWPRLASTQAIRFLDPFGDHPPFARYTLDVRPGSANVIFGKSLDVSVDVGGGPVDEVDLVSQLDKGREESLPMFQQGGGTWNATLADLTEAGQYFVRAAGARSTRFDIHILTRPRIETVELTITPPAYTRRPPYIGPLPTGGIHALPGTSIGVRATSNRPLQSGTLDGSTTSLTLQPDAANRHTAVGTLVVVGPDLLHLSLTDAQGQSSDETFDLPIALDQDARPFVRLAQPVNPSFATPDASIAVQLDAEDDFGISRLELYRSLNDSKPLPLDLSVPTPVEARVSASTTLDLAPLDLQPGDTIKLFARAEDNDPAQAKGAESAVSVLRIISQEQMGKLLVAERGVAAMQSKYQDVQRRLDETVDRAEQLEKLLSSTDATTRPDASVGDQVEPLVQQMNDDATAVDALAEHPLPLDLDQKLAPELRTAAGQLRKAADILSNANTARPATAAGARNALGEAVAQLKQGRDRLEQEAAKPLAALEQAMPLLSQQQRFIAVTQSQRDLATRMPTVPGETSAEQPRARARLRDLEDEQRRLDADLTDVLDRIADQVKSLPADPAFEDLRTTATAFERAVRASDASQEMRDAINNLAGSDGNAAAEQATAAATTLESFVGQCNATGAAAGACLKFQPTLSNALGQTVQQLLSASADAAVSDVSASAGSGSGVGRSTLENVGLYGSIPMTAARSGARGGHADHGTASDGRSTDRGSAIATFQQQWKLDGSGTNDAPLPPEYRDRISDYFRRVVEELPAGEHR